jgi:hypothetical protein
MSRKEEMAMRVRMGCSSVVAVLIVGTVSSWGCVPMRVSSYAERTMDIRSYHTFTWAPPDATSTGDPRLDNNRFFDERVRAQVDKQLESRGFEKTTVAPDLLVHYHASVTQEIDVRELDSQYANEFTRGPSYVYDKGTLFVDLVEPATGRLLWRGWAEGSIDGVVDKQEWMESRIDAAVGKILKQLPNRL